MKHTLRLVLLLVIISLLAVPVLAQRTNSIDFGETVQGELDSEHQTRQYTFDGEAGQTVSITLLSDDYDPLVVLLGPDGQEVAMNDDGGSSGLNSQIGPFALPETGEYTIVADSYGHYFNNASTEAEGRFTLLLEEVNIQRIEYTQQVKGELTTEQPAAYYQFRGQQGDVVNVVVGTDGFGANVTLSSITPEDMGTILSSGADYSGEGVAMIGGFTLPETASYLLVVTSSNGDLGEFTLAVDKVDVTPLTFDAPVDLSFDAESPLAYLSFEAEAGDVISLTVRSRGDFDTTLALNSPDGYQLNYVDDTYGLDPALIDQILQVSGIYTVIVRPYSQGAEGEVSLTLERSELATLDGGPVTLQMSSSHNRDTVTLSADAGAVVRLVLEVTDRESASPNVTVTQGQETIAYSSGSMVRRLSMDFTVPADGTLYVQVDEYTYADVTLVLTSALLSDDSAPVVVTEPVEDALTPTPTPAMLPTEEVTATDEADGMIDVTEEPMVEPTAAATEPVVVTEAPAPATEEPAPAETVEPGPEETKAA